MKIRSLKTATTNSGFSLLELAFVIAIIGILASLAIPLFLAKVPREQIKESVPLVSIVTDKVTKYYVNSKEGALPADNATADLPDATSIVGIYVSAINVTDGAVTVTFRKNANGKIAGKQLTWRPVVPKDRSVRSIQWLCGPKKVPDTMDVGGVDATNIPPDTLPLGPECGVKSAAQKSG